MNEEDIEEGGAAQRHGDARVRRQDADRLREAIRTVLAKHLKG